MYRPSDSERKLTFQLSLQTNCQSNPNDMIYDGSTIIPDPLVPWDTYDKLQHFMLNIDIPHIVVNVPEFLAYLNLMAKYARVTGEAN